ncbi:MAG: V-type ATPase subunit [Anaplasmataceae bacterium]|nr:V-type ATPase subunit [Anaplasmataceae bacterium]
MDSKYIYASTVAYTLHQKLLSETQLELLLSTRSREEFMKALQDTFVAPYLSSGKDERVTHILDQIVRAAKEELVKIAPEPGILEILWAKYDFQNLKTLITWNSLGLDESKLEESWVHLGSHSLRELLKAFREGKLEDLNPRLYQALQESERQKNDALKDLIIDANYLRTIRDMAAKTKNKFIQEFVQIRIDLFNLLSRLRILASSENGSIPKDFFLHGGSYTNKDLEAEENILRLLTNFGGKKHWKEALSEYQESKKFSGLSRAADEYVLGWLKRQSIELHSVATLVAYFMAVKNSVQVVRTIAISKQLGVSEQKIRSIVRKPYQSYAF